jgi:uncharacterized phage protein (TIGR02218 family)
MKIVVTDYRYRVMCMKIVPVTGSTIYLTDHVKDLVMGGHTYLSTSGYEFTGYSSTTEFSPGSIDFEGISGAAGISRATVASGLFDGARCYVFATSWVTPVEDEEAITAGIFGKATLVDDRYQIEGMSLVDTLNQTVGETYSVQCPKKFLGQEYGGCMVNVAANTVTGTLTSVTNASTFYSAARSEAADTFGGGTIKFTSGVNAGLPAIDIRSFSGGNIVTFEPFYYTPSAGDAYSMTRGCRKRLSDCQARWNGSSTYSNVLNFGGFPWIPAGSTYSQFGQGG